LGNAEWPVCCTVEITRDDYALLNQARNRLLTTRQRIIVILRLVLFVGAVTYVVAAVSGQSWVEFAIFLSLFVAVLGGLAHRFTGRLNMWRFYNTYRVDKSAQSYELDPTGFSISSSSFSGKFDWKAYHALMRTPEHFLFWINPMQAHIVPFRVLKKSDIDKVWGLLAQMPNARVEEVRA